MRRPLAAASPPAPDKPGPPGSANKTAPKTLCTSETTGAAHRGLEFGAGGPAGRGPAATGGPEPYQSRPAAERSGPAGHGGQGGPSTAAAPAGTGEGPPGQPPPQTESRPTAAVSFAAAGREPSPPLAGVRRSRVAASPPAPDKPGPPGSANKTAPKTPRISGTSSAANRGLEFGAGGPASSGPAATVGLKPHQSRPGPAAEGSELAGRGRPGDPDPSTPTPTPTPAPPSAGAAAGEPAGTGQGLPAGRGPAATGQSDRSLPAAEALA